MLPEQLPPQSRLSGTAMPGTARPLRVSERGDRAACQVRRAKQLPSPAMPARHPDGNVACASTARLPGACLLDFAYPRPQLQRAEWISLNGPWRFRYDDERRFSMPSEIFDWPM